MERYDGIEKPAEAMSEVRRLNRARGRRPAAYWPAMATIGVLWALSPFTTYLPGLVAFVAGPILVIATAVLAGFFQTSAQKKARYSPQTLRVQVLGAVAIIAVLGLDFWLFSLTRWWIIPIAAAALMAILILSGGRTFERRWSGDLSTHV